MARNVEGIHVRKAERENVKKSDGENVLDLDGENVKKAVRRRYGEIAKKEGSCCGPAAGHSCGCGAAPPDISKLIGYSAEELGALPGGADLGLGCGNPVALASLKNGETVLDLGSGAGIDCFLAARKVGPKGKVIGVDMTAEMLEKAKKNAASGGYRNVEFRLGEIEHLPVADGSVDAVISNCVINLSPEKEQVFREVFRALRPGGRMMVSDIVLLKKLPPNVANSIDAYIGCIAGAETKPRYLAAIARAGFKDVRVEGESSYPLDLADPQIAGMVKQLGLSAGQAKDVAGSIVSVKVRALKPK
jgi:SAM-dependent methyltransferase